MKKVKTYSEAESAIIDFPTGCLIKVHPKMSLDVNANLFEKLYASDTDERPIAHKRISKEDVYMVLGAWPEENNELWTGRIIFKLLDGQKPWYFFCHAPPTSIFIKLKST